MSVFQKHIKLSPRKRGFNLVTEEIILHLPELKLIDAGILNLFLQHTSASLSISENADPTVRIDLETHFNKSVPEDELYYRHVDEGTDDMTSHIKNVIIGSSLSIPIINKKLALGTWQGIYLCEHRNSAHSRNIVATIIGENK